jgi:hypothetical protein
MHNLENKEEKGLKEIEENKIDNYLNNKINLENKIKFEEKYKLEKLDEKIKQEEELRRNELENF